MTDDSFRDPDLASTAEYYWECRSALVKLLGQFMETHDLDEGMTVDLLVDLAISFHTIDYFNRVKKPSAGGLRLELDRLRREFDSSLRDARKEADSRVKLLFALLEESEPVPRE